MSIRFFAGVSVLAAALLPVHAGAIHLRWDAVPQATGYRVYYGAQSRQYTASVNAGNATSTVVNGLTDCQTWYLAVKAYNSSGESPSFSNEIIGWPRPEVASSSPSAGIQGGQLTLNVAGANFQPGASIEVDNPDVFLASPVVTCNQIRIAATVEPTARGVRPAEVGRFKVTVVNPDDVFGERSNGFEVTLNPARFDIDQRQGPSRGRLDGRDTIWISRLFGSREGDNTYHPDSDFNGDGWVDGQDLAYVASNLGRCWSGTAWSAAACPGS